MDGGGNDLDAVLFLKLRNGCGGAGGEDLPAAAAVHGPAVDEEGAVAAEAGGVFCEAPVAKAEVEELIESPEGPGRVGGAPAHAGADRDILAEVDAYRRQAELPLQQAVSLDAQLFLDVSAGQLEGCSIIIHRDGVRLDDFQDVLPPVVHREEKCLYVVVAVASAGGDPQADVDLRPRVEHDIHGINRICRDRSPGRSGSPPGR